jgi:hypothetical protein
MNELERLIAAIPRPEPGTALDARVGALITAERSRRPRLGREGWLALFATSACMGVVGFALGRQSEQSAPEPRAIHPAVAAQLVNENASIPGNITLVRLREDQRAGLFVRPGAGEGMFGTGPVTIETLTTP